MAEGIDVSAFLAAGCSLYHAVLHCEGSPAIKPLRCSRAELELDESLAGLSPRRAIARCDLPLSIARNIPPDDDRGVVFEGGMAGVLRQYLVVEGGKFQLVQTAAEFRALFAPVDSPDEALAFAVALTVARSVRELRPPAGARMLAGELRGTSVEPRPGGFAARLFQHRTHGCDGCGPHELFAVDYLVTRDGDVSELAEQIVYEDPPDPACIDSAATQP